MQMPMEPPVLEDQAFGRVTWDDGSSEFSGRCEVSKGLTIDLSVDPFSDVLPNERPPAVTEPQLLAARVASRLRLLLANLDRIRAYAAEELLLVHNEDWANGPPIDGPAFAARLRLMSIAIDGDLCARAFFDDNGLFAGHAVIVSTNESGEVAHAELFG